nr:reverse transcriptase domain-containing protein [Tanacetum cinerariifolium]
FYNALNSKDQDSLNSAAGGNFLDKMPLEGLAIIESKSKVRYSRNKLVVAKVSTNTSTSGISPDVAELKDIVKALLFDKKGQNQSPAPVKQSRKVEDFLAYVKANDAVMRNMQTQGQNMQNQLTNLTDLITKFVNSNSASTLSSGMAECLALADLDASINLMPFFVWKRLSLPDLTPTCMTLELADRSISRPVGVAEDVYVKVGELTLRVGKKAITFNLDQTSRYSANYSDMTAKRIDVIDMACEEYSDFLLEEVDTFLAIKDDPTSLEFYQPYLDPEGDIPLLEAFLNDDPSLSPPNHGNYLAEVRKELKIYEAKFDKSSIDKPSEIELKDLPPYLEYAFLEGDNKLPVIIEKYLSVEEKTALKNVQHQRRINPKIHDVIKQEVIKLLEAGLIYLISDSHWVSPVHCVPKNGGFTVIENEDNELILTRLVTAPILIAPDWDMPFELMCDASDFTIGAVLGKHQDKHFRPIHYASKTMTEAESNYTTTEKEMLAVEFTFKVIDTKGAENLAADHLSRLENPHQNVLDPKEINESFPLETLNLVSTRGNQSTPWFADFANYHAWNFVVKGMSSQQKSENCSSWSDKLDDALGAFRTAYKTPIGCTPYKLVYGKACHLPIELEHKAYWALKHAKFDLKTVGDHRKVQINELNELCDQAYENSLIYKEKTKRLHDSKIKDRVFNIDDRVPLFNSRLKIFSGKLKSRWSGPFTISQVYPYDTVELSQPDMPNFKVNGHCVKHYFGEDIPKLVVPDLQTFPMDH